MYLELDRANLHSRKGYLVSDWKPSLAFKANLAQNYKVSNEMVINGIRFISTEDGDAWKSRPRLTFQDFVDLVKKYNTSDIIRAIGAQREELFSPGRDMENQKIVNAWAAAVIIRESIRHGSENPKSHEFTILELMNLFEALAYAQDQEPDRYDSSKKLQSQWKFKTLTRVAYEQFPWQESIYEELARTSYIFQGQLSEEHIHVKAAVENSLGIPITDALGAALIIYSAANAGGGVWNPAVLNNPKLIEIFDIVPKKSVLAVSELLTCDRNYFISQFDSLNAKVVDSTTPPNLRYAYNPLITNPIFKLDNGELIVPLPHLLYRRFTLSNLYYDGIGNSDADFTNPLGHVISHYVGEQLNELCLSGGIVFPEFSYKHGKDTSRTIDWFVSTPDCLLFIEVKSLRLTLGERMGLLSAKNGIYSKIDEAFKQINISYTHYKNGSKSEFNILPQGRKPIGLVITSDPVYHGNSPEMRQKIRTPLIDTLIVSLRELERMVAWEAGVLGQALIAIVENPVKSSSPVALSLGDNHSKVFNKILDQTIQAVPIFHWSPEEEKEKFS